MDKWNIPGLMEFQRNFDKRGNITILDTEYISDHFLSIKRAFWIMGVPSGEVRGGHAHKDQSQILVSIRGNVVVTVKKLDKEFSFFLNDPGEGLFVPPGWRIDMSKFSVGCVLLVFSTGYYREDEYC